MKYSKNSVIVFFAIVIILSISFETLYIVFGNQISILLLMWSPAFAAIVCGYIIKAENKDSGEKIMVGSLLGFRVSKIRYILLGIFNEGSAPHNGDIFIYQSVVRAGRRDRLEGIHASGIV